MPPTQYDPEGQALHELAPAREYVVPEQLEQVAELGPENFPLAHCVSIPPEHLDPAGHVLHALAPARE